MDDLQVMDERLYSKAGISDITVKDMDAGEGTLRVIVSDDTMDRDGEIIRATASDHGAGWLLDDFRKNPVMLFMHNPFMPVGDAKDTDVIDGKLMSTMRFFDMDGVTGEMADFNRYVARAYLSGRMRAVSAGFEPMKWLDPDTTKAESRKTGDRMPPPANGREYVEQKLWEFSPVSIPSNPNAVTVQRAAKSMANIAQLMAIPKADRDRMARASTDLIELLERTIEVVEKASKGEEVKKKQAKVDTALSPYARLFGARR